MVLKQESAGGIGTTRKMEPETGISTSFSTRTLHSHPSKDTVVTRPLRRHPSSLPAKTELTGCFSGRSGRVCVYIIFCFLKVTEFPRWETSAYYVVRQIPDPFAKLNDGGARATRFA